MSDRDGVIKFQLDFKKATSLPVDSLRELISWRQLLFLAGLIGQNTTRYEGAGFGNISRRLVSSETTRESEKFVISGSQTGGLSQLNETHFSLVTECHPLKNQIRAEGPIAPSSEAMTHGIIYDCDPKVQWVIHVHSPEIWKNSDQLNLPKTDPIVPYGTPLMAVETEKLMRSGHLGKRPVFVMGGHEDGVLSFGKTADEAGFSLLKVFVQSLALR